MTAAVCVMAEEVSDAARAMPKSMTLTSPDWLSMTLAGLMSRCTIPAVCATSRAVQTSAVISSARGGGSRRCSSSSSRRVRPSTYSMTM